jgi:tRNA (adenine22-N1)-methyltransferase
MVLAPPRLGARLAAVLRHVVPGAPLADIGADHGLLAIAAVAGGTVPTAIAIDRARAPLAMARANVAHYGLDDRVTIRVGDGLRPLAPGEVATVAIAGVGARAIRAMLERVDPASLGLRRLVLQPQTEPEALQDWLAARWRLAGAVLVHEAGRGYMVYWVDV